MAKIPDDTGSKSAVQRGVGFDRVSLYSLWMKAEASKGCMNIPSGARGGTQVVKGARLRRAVSCQGATLRSGARTPSALVAAWVRNPPPA
jgi:hypothetical protein